MDGELLFTRSYQVDMPSVEAARGSAVAATIRAFPDSFSIRTRDKSVADPIRMVARIDSKLDRSSLFRSARATLKHGNALLQLSQLSDGGVSLGLSGHARLRLVLTPQAKVLILHVLPINIVNQGVPNVALASSSSLQLIAIRASTR